jgi:hypothetical protein
VKDVWRDNLAFLQGSAGVLYKKVTAEETDEETDLEVSLTGRRDLVKVKRGDEEIFLGSTFDPGREMRRLADGCDEKTGLLILLGAGNLKLLGELKKRFKFLRRLIIIEPSLKIFKTLLREIPLRQIFAAFPRTDISIVLNEDLQQVSMWHKAFILEHPSESSSVVIPVGYGTLFPLYYRKLRQFNASASFQASGSVATRRAFRYCWHINEWRNLKIRAAEYGILTPIIRGLPVIVVSAGPSLDKNVHLLKEVGDRAFIIAVGSAIRILHNKGIVPHLRLSIEGNAIQWRLFDGIDPSECPLGYVAQINWSVLRPYDGNCIEIFAGDNCQAKKLLFRLRGLFPRYISSGSSVSNLGVFLAEACGASHIIIMGQDLCGQLGKNYAAGSWASAKENSALMETSRNLPVKNMYGQEVYTTPTYLDIKLSLEYAAEHGRARFINATEGGLTVNGYENRRFADVLAQVLPAEAPRALREDLKAAIQSNILNDLWDRETERQFCQKYKDEVAEVRRETDVLRKIAGAAVENKRIGKVRNQYDKIRALGIYEQVLTNVFGYEEIAVREALLSPDPAVRADKVRNFADELITFIDFSSELTEEFLADEEQINVVFQF